ncbi:MAG: hypothetical protein LW630_09720 [Saprospiraceae bacterium]|nr:hypothetical protein [Saprospiraceae bacterium]
MQTRLFILLFHFVGLCTLVNAQPVTVSSYETMIETAITAAENNDYVNAIEWFEKAYAEKKDPNLQVAIGDMYVLLRDYPKAEKTYERVIRRDKRDEFFDLRLDWARAMKAQGKYREALDELFWALSLTRKM